MRLEERMQTTSIAHLVLLIEQPVAAFDERQAGRSATEAEGKCERNEALHVRPKVLKEPPYLNLFIGGVIKMFLNSCAIRRTMEHPFVHVNTVFLCCRLVFAPSVPLIFLTLSGFNPSKLLRFRLVWESI